jgi:hypothetical protein
MNKKAKKKWNPPVIASTLSIKQTLNVPGSLGMDGGMGQIMYTS